jgi:hypothetical protein
MYHRMFAKFLQAEMELNQERKEILEQLRDPRKDLLLELLDNNINSTRRLRGLKECFLGRMAQNELESDDDDDCECGCCGCGDEDEDEIFIHDDAEETEADDDEEEDEDDDDGVYDDEGLTVEQQEEIEHSKCLSALVDGDKE